MVEATGLEPATTCTPTMPPAAAPVPTGRTDSQGLGITEEQDAPLGAQRSPAASGGMGNGAHMGRGRLPEGETGSAALEEFGRQVAAAVARGDFDRARQLTEASIRLRTAERSTSEENLLTKRPWPSDS